MPLIYYTVGMESFGVSVSTVVADDVFPMHDTLNKSEHERIIEKIDFILYYVYREFAFQ